MDDISRRTIPRCLEAERMATSSATKRNRLKGSFEVVRKTFFPLWDKKNLWRIRCIPSLPSIGKCDTETKTIKIQNASTDNNVLYSLLIHEICHAVSSCGHEITWHNRMMKAANRAKNVGKKDLADLIIKEIKNYEGIKSRVNAAEIYSLIEDVVIEQPTMSYKAVIKYVANNYGYSAKELETKYKSCKIYFDKSLKFAKNFL